MTEQINRVPVVDDGRLVGVVTRGDVLGAIAGLDHDALDLTKEPVVVGPAGFLATRGIQFSLSEVSHD